MPLIILLKKKVIKMKTNIKKIEKVFLKEMQKEVMWFFGIHILNSPRAEFSYERRN